MSHSALSWAPPPAWQADNSKPRVNAQPTRQALEQRRGLIFEGTPAASHHLGAYPPPHPATYRPCRATSSGGHPLSFFSSSWPFACIACAIGSDAEFLSQRLW